MEKNASSNIQVYDLESLMILMILKYSYFNATHHPVFHIIKNGSIHSFSNHCVGSAYFKYVLRMIAVMYKNRQIQGQFIIH